MVDAARSADGTEPLGAPTRVRVPPLLLGTFLFLASELVFFVALFGSYFTLRSETPVWPPRGVELEPVLAGIATGLLVISSFSYLVATRRARAHDRRGFRSWLGVTF